MTVTFTYLNPRAWVESQPTNWGCVYDRSERRWRGVLNYEQIVAEWEKYFFGRLVSRSLQLLNTEHYMRRDTSWINHRLEVEAIAAGQLVGVRFTPGKSRSEAMLDGDLSTEWLKKKIQQAVLTAVDQWDPNRALSHSIEMSARARAPRPNRKPKYSTELLATVADKPPFVQSEILGIPIATIHRMRKRLDLRSGVLA